MIKITLFLALSALCLAGAAKFPASYRADMDFMYKQKKVYELLLFSTRHNYEDTEFYDIGKSYHIKEDLYTNKTIVQKFNLWCEHNLLLERDAIFSIYNSENVAETKMLFDLFYHAKDFDTFFKTACWARLHMNSGIFTTAFTVAIFYRPDCKYMSLPPIYEIYPNFFYDSKIITDIQRFQFHRGEHNILYPRHTPEWRHHTCSMYANYSGRDTLLSKDEDARLDYFTEDPDSNAFYYYFRQVLPFWLNEEFITEQYKMPKNIRGQFYFYIHKQLLNRYNLDRFSNGFGDTTDFDWNKLIYPGFNPMQMFPNGVSLPQRPFHSWVPSRKYKYLKEIHTLESRLMNAIDIGYLVDDKGAHVNIYTPEGFNMLANLFEGNVNSCNRRFYGMYDALARDILGFSFDYRDRNHMIPSGLQCYTTSMRDPAFYMLYKRIMTYFMRYKKYQPMYTENDLALPEVKIQSVEIDHLRTYFGTCGALANSAMPSLNVTSSLNSHLKICRPCLKYEPYTYKLNVHSDKKMEAIVRIFLGPAFDDVRFDRDYLHKFYYHFLEMDKFSVSLQAGANTITRSSSQSIMTMPDMMPSNIFLNKLNEAISGGEPLSYSKKFFGFSERLTLPRGRPGGLRFKMFFILNELENSEVYDFPMLGEILFDDKPLGFPLDRPMRFFDRLNSTLPNMYLRDVFIDNDPRMRA